MVACVALGVGPGGVNTLTSPPGVLQTSGMRNAVIRGSKSGSEANIVKVLTLILLINC